MKKYFFSTIDTLKDIFERYEALQKFCLLLEKEHTPVFRKWKLEVLMRLSKYSDWLAVVIENQQKIKPKLLTSKIQNEESSWS
jgi:hypothetical protein